MGFTVKIEEKYKMLLTGFVYECIIVYNDTGCIRKSKFSYNKEVRRVAEKQKK